MKLSHKQWGGTANRLQNSRFFRLFLGQGAPASVSGGWSKRKKINVSFCISLQSCSFFYPCTFHLTACALLAYTSIQTALQPIKQARSN